MTVFIDGPRMPPKRGGKPDSLVILLHGYGSNGADLLSLAPYFAEALPGAHFVAPNAIEPTPQAPGGYQWFGISRIDPVAMEAGVRAAAPSVERFIDRELERHGLDESRLVLVGFSQGTMMALHCGLRRAKPPAGIIGYSGTLVAAGSVKTEVKAAPPILLVHGDQDQVVSIKYLFESTEALAAAGFGAQWHISYGLPHSIGPDGIELGSAFLSMVLKQKPISAR